MRSIKQILTIGIVAMSVTLAVRAQDPSQDQPDNDTDAAIQAAAAAAFQAGMERAAELQPDAQPAENDASTTQPAVQEDEQPQQHGGNNPPTTRPVNRNRMNFQRPRTSSTRPAAAPVRPKSIFTDYTLLLHRSMFIKGNQTNVIDSAAAKPTTAPVIEMTRAERNLIFNGVTESDDTVALVEDTGSHKISKLRVGDSIAGGKIGRISFDDLDYVANGKTITIEIGQNFEGMSATPTSEPATYSANTASGTSNAGSGTAGGASAPALSPAAAQSVLERMRQRRMQETGGK